MKREDNMIKNIETERLILRCFLPEDALQIHPLFCDDEAMRLVGMYPAFTKLKQTQERIGRWAGNPRRLAIVLKNSNKVIGYVAVDSRDEKCEDTKELGFAINEKCRRKGYIREAVTAIQETLKMGGVKYLWACCFEENAASENFIRSMDFKFQKRGTYAAINDRTYVSLEFMKEL